MSDIIEKTIQFTYRPRRETKSEPGGRKNPANAHFFRPWGYPIYRTYYGPGSDESWNEILYSLKQQTRLGLGAFEDEDQNDVQQLKELFHLNAYEDPATLDGLDVRGASTVLQQASVGYIHSLFRLSLSFRFDG